MWKAGDELNGNLDFYVIDKSKKKGVTDTIAVYEAKDALGHVYAIKAPRSDIALYIEKKDDLDFEYEDWPIGKERFKREINNLKELNADKEVSKGVVLLEDCGIYPFPWIVMELGSQELTKVLKNSKFPKIIVDLLYKLYRIHSMRIIHGDITPGNIMLMGGVWKFIDFDLSTHNHSDKNFVGTAKYASPEKKKREHDDIEGGIKDDLYSMGLILYEGLSS